MVTFQPLFNFNMQKKLSKQITFFYLFIRIQHHKYLLKDMVLGKSDQNKIYYLVALHNTAGLYAESSFHIPKRGLRTIW